MDVAGDNRGNGANVQQFPWNGGANQRWYARGPNNNFELVNVNSGKCLDVQDGGMGNNVNIVQMQCSGRSNQRWFAGYSMPGGPGVPGRVDPVILAAQAQAVRAYLRNLLQVWVEDQRVPVNLRE